MSKQKRFFKCSLLNIGIEPFLQVSDKDQIMGLVQLENLQILAEAYDVALDMSFPKGTEGGIDFGTNRVGETVKQTISLKNKGRYDCGFQLVLILENYFTF